MWLTSKTAAACARPCALAMIDEYCTGIAQPANSTMRAPAATCSSYSGVRFITPPRRRRARTHASNVLRNSIATVIGPTPPGTGVMNEARRSAAAYSTSPTSVAADAIDADVDHDRAGLDPFAAHQLGAADRRDDDVGSAHLRGEVRRARMAHDHRRVALEQHHGDRLADEHRATDDDGMQAVRIGAGPIEEIHAADRRARPQTGAPGEQRALVQRMQPVDVFARIDRGDRGFRIEMTRAAASARGCHRCRCARCTSRTTSSNRPIDAEAGSSTDSECMPTSRDSRCLRPTYTLEAGSSPTRIVTRPGRRLPCSARARMRCASSARIPAANVLPSMRFATPPASSLHGARHRLDELERRVLRDALGGQPMRAVVADDDVDTALDGILRPLRAVEVRDSTAAPWSSRRSARRTPQHRRARSGPAGYPSRGRSSSNAPIRTASTFCITSSRSVVSSIVSAMKRATTSGGTT